MAKTTKAAAKKRAANKTSKAANMLETRKTTKKAKAPASARSTKTDQVLELLRRENGATTAELLAATGWQAHSLRGFISGSLRKKQGLAVELVKVEGGESRYRIK
jgi:hypothetical protein